jgi:hypothetical protein
MNPALRKVIQSGTKANVWLYRRTPLCQDQVRHQGQPLLVELEG